MILPTDRPVLAQLVPRYITMMNHCARTVTQTSGATTVKFFRVMRNRTTAMPISTPK